MAVLLSPIGGVAAQFFDNSGAPLSGGKLYTYAAGTTTPVSTYTSSTGGTPHANPIVLDAAGRVPGGEIWLTDGVQYKFVIKTSTDTLIGTYDNIVGINSNFVNYTSSQEIQTATANQTVFTLTTMAYQPGTNSLSVFVDGVNQYGPGAQYAYVETDSTTVTFEAGLHVGAQVKFTTTAINSSSYGNAFQVSYTPPFTNSVTTNVGDKLAQTVSVKDFGAVGDGVTDDTAAIQAAMTYANVNNQVLDLVGGEYKVSAVSLVANNFSMQNGKITAKGGNDEPVVFDTGSNGVFLRNIIFNGNANAYSCLKFYTSTNVVIDTCQFLNAGALTNPNTVRALWVEGSTDVVIRSCKFYNALSSVVARHLLISKDGAGKSCNGVIIDSCYFDTVDVAGTPDGDCIAVEDITHVGATKVVNNYFVNFNKRAVKAGGSGWVISDNTFKQIATGSTGGTFAVVSAYGNDIKILNNVFDVAAGNNIYHAISVGSDIVNPTDIDISHNSFYMPVYVAGGQDIIRNEGNTTNLTRSEEHTSELQSH